MNGKKIANVFWGAAIVIALLVGSAIIVHPAISQLAGLAVAQTSTQWNNVIDAARGDDQSSGIIGMSLYLFDGLNFDRTRGDTTNGMDVDVTRISGSITPADDFANPTTANTMWVLNGVFDGTTWDRLREATADGAAITGLPASAVVVFNGATWDRMRSVSAVTNTETTTLGVQRIAPVSTWSVTNTPATATQATVSRASGGGSVRHVATSVTVCVSAAGTAQTPLLFHLRDGGTGAGTIIRSWAFSAPINTSACEDISGLNMTGSAATAMTIESAAAPVTAAQATVTLTGYSTP